MDENPYQAPTSRAMAQAPSKTSFLWLAFGMLTSILFLGTAGALAITAAVLWLLIATGEPLPKTPPRMAFWFAWGTTAIAIGLGLCAAFLRWATAKREL